MKDDRAYLTHILDCLEAIRNHVAAGKESFFSDRKTRKAVIRELQEIAESTQRLSHELKDRHSGIPWRDIAGIRVSVSVIVGSVPDGDTFEQILNSYLQLTREDLEAGCDTPPHLEDLMIP